MSRRTTAPRQVNAAGILVAFKGNRSISCQEKPRFLQPRDEKGHLETPELQNRPSSPRCRKVTYVQLRILKENNLPLSHHDRAPPRHQQPGGLRLPRLTGRQNIKDRMGRYISRNRKEAESQHNTSERSTGLYRPLSTSDGREASRDVKRGTMANPAIWALG